MGWGHHIILHFVLVFLVSFVSCEEDWFGVDSTEDTDDFDLGQTHPALQILQKSSRDDSLATAADLEVILNSGPMIAPDIIIRNFVDPKMTFDKMMEHVGNADKKPYHDEEDEGYTDSDILLDHPSFAQENEINDLPEAEDTEDMELAEKADASNDPKLKAFVGKSPCRMKLNGTSGKFSLNFTRDCLILVTTPKKKSTLVLNCSPVALGNCSMSRDTLTVNFKGDLRFGRNSYVYCGSNVQVRATSIRQKISIRVRKALEGYHDQIAHCEFHSRQRRDLYSTDAELLAGISSHSRCGRLGRSSKIVGGRKVAPGLFPWVAQLDITRIDGSQTACTGSLVSPKYVLTAAHCLRNAESISVFMGGTDRHEFTGSEVVVQAEKYILHRRWSPRTLMADIALVRLTEDIKYTEEVSPICLPKGKLKQENLEGRKAVAVGWGRVESRKKAPRRLYRVRLPVLDDGSCQQHYRRFYVPKLMVCTDSDEDKAICYGDSGGPLMYKRKEKVFAVGVASFSLSKTCGASPDVFTHVGEYVSWIEGRISEEIAD